MSDAPELQRVAPAAKKRTGGLVLLLFVAMAAAGGGVYWWMSRGPVAAATVEVPLSARGLVAFEPFMVNLADGGGSRYLKVTLRLVLENRAAADGVTSSEVIQSRVRSEILELLTEQTATALVTPEGKTALKQAITSRVEPILNGTKVIDVLFSEFVVQF